MMIPKQPAEDLDFEEGLRQILAHNAAPTPNSDNTTVKPHTKSSVAQKMIAAANERSATERKMLFYFKILRITAVAAFAALLALFVSRIISFAG